MTISTRVGEGIASGQREGSMAKDRYDLSVPTGSAAACDALVAALDLTLAGWPGAVAGFDAALAHDPRLTLARLGKARALQAGGNLAAAQAVFAEVATTDSTDPRTDSQRRILGALFGGRPADAFAGVQNHLSVWPRDALVASLIANQLGLIATSGRPDREKELTEALGALAPHYGDDWWFNGHYGMALSEIGRQDEGGLLTRRSLAVNPSNATAAHAEAHVRYETGELEAGREFLRGWLPSYPADGMLHGHITWHLALVELARGDAEAGFSLFTESFGAEPYRAGPLIVKMMDAASFLWRSELAGHPRDLARLAFVRDFVSKSFPKPSIPYADWHAGLIEAATGDGAALAVRIEAIEALVAAGRYPAGETMPAVLRGFGAFARQDWTGAIAAIEPMLDARARLSGSQAQLDLIEFTLLHAYVQAGRMDAAQALLARRRQGPPAGPLAALH
jgi:hypothetical protein